MAEPEAVTLETPGVKELVEAAVKENVDAAIAKATEGLVSNRDALKAEKTALQEKYDADTAQWKGFDPEKVKTLMDRMANDEETKLIAEGKIDEVINRRVDALKTDFETKLSAGTEKISELEGSLKTKDGKIKSLVIDGFIRQAASEHSVVAGAIPDAITRANGRFDLDENLKPVARDEGGALLMGKNGKDPLTPSEWLEGMRENAPHWFPPPKGGGSQGGGGGGTGDYTITREAARDPAVYRAAKAEAEKAGQPLQFVE
jgi:hypothetical protein